MDLSTLAIILVILVIGVIYFYREAEQETERKIELAAFMEDVKWIGEGYLKNGIQEISPDIALPKNEKLFALLGNAEWWEPRRVTTGYQAGGFTGRVRIAKGLSYRWASGNIQRQTVNQFIMIDKGSLYVTDKRFLLRGLGGTKSLPFNKVLMLTADTFGFLIEKESGKNVLIKYPFARSPDQMAICAAAWQKAFQ